MSASTKQANRQSGIAQFIENLNTLTDSEKARLRRNAGRTIAESRGVLPIFYRTLPYTTPERDHETYFMVATLFSFAKNGNDRNLGATLKRIKDDGKTAGPDRRMTALLDADSGQLTFRLRQLVRLIHAHDQHVNWKTLLDDLLRWQLPNRPVQRRWAMAYYGTPPRDSPSTEQEAQPKDNDQTSS